MVWNSFTYGTDFHEHRSPEFGVDENGMTATRWIWLDDFTNISTFLQEFMGQRTITGSSITASNPEVFPSMPHLIAKTAKVSAYEPTETRTQLTGEDLYYSNQGQVVECNYATMPYDLNGPGQGEGGDQLPDPPVSSYFEVDGTGRIQLVELPTSALKWELVNDKGKDIVPEKVVGGTPYSVIDWTITWHDVPEPNWGGILFALGKTNVVTFAGFPEDTTLFATIGFHRSSKPDGSRMWKLTYGFWTRAIEGMSESAMRADDITVTKLVAPGWNYALRPDPDPTHVHWQRFLRRNVSDPNAKDLVILQADLATELFSF